MKNKWMSSQQAFILLLNLAVLTWPLELGAVERPNILLVIVDDQSWCHVGCYGDPAVRTPAIDDLARNGIRFENAYCASPSCSPSRAGILTGQDVFRIEEAGILTGFIRDKYPVFPLLLEKTGYVIGYTGKGYAPCTRNVPKTYQRPLGKSYHQERLTPPGDGKGISKLDYATNLDVFLNERPKDRPFFFWVGMTEPHLPHARGLGDEFGIDQNDIRVPDFYPRSLEVRQGLSDYLAEIEWADGMLARMVASLKKRNLLNNTLMVFTSDNGMPFPRAKATLYEYGVRVPLIIHWPTRVHDARRVTDPVSLIDLAPTILEVAGIRVPAVMTGRSLKPLLFSQKNGHIDPKREFVVTVFEKHTSCRPGMLSFPRRALHTAEWTYIHNYEPLRDPAGAKDVLIPTWGVYGDIDPSLIKTYFMEQENDPRVRPYYLAGFGKVPPEELFHRTTDPHHVHDVAADPAYAEVLRDLRKKLDTYLIKHHDPRAKGLSPWDDYNLDKPFPIPLPAGVNPITAK